MNRPQEIVDFVATKLGEVVTGSVVNIQGTSYTFQNTFPSSRVYRGRKILSVDTDTYPALSVVTPTGVAVGGNTPPGNESILMTMDVEAADKLNGRDIYTVAMALLDDIRAAIPVKTRTRGAAPLQPGYSGAPTWEIQEPPSGSDLVMVRRTYSAIYVEIFPI